MPDLGKATYVVTIESRDFERKLQALDAKTKRSAASQNRELSGMARDWNKVTSGVERTSGAVDKNSQSNERNRNSLRGLGKDLATAGLAFKALSGAIGLLKWPTIITGAGYAAQALSVLAGGAVALTGALGPLIGALTALPALYGAIGQGALTTMLAFKPVIGVVKEMSAAQTKGAATATRSAAAQKTAAASIIRAEQAVAAAHNEVREDQRKLTEARREAEQQIVSLRLAAEGSVLSEKRATLSLQQARQTLMKAEVGGKTSSMELRNLRLSVQEAELGVHEARVNNKVQQEELNEAESKGVKHSTQVTEARKALAKAHQNVGNALRGLAQAERQNTAAMESGGSAASTLKQKMSELSPAAQKFAHYLFSLKGTLKGLRAAAGAEMFPGVEAGTKAAMRNLPVLEKILERTGGAVGNIAARAGKLFGSEGFGSRLQKVGALNASTLERLGTTGLKLGDALTHVMVAARPLDNWMGKLLVDFGKYVDHAAAVGQQSGKLARFFERTKEVMTTLGHTAREFAVGVYHIFQAGTPLGNNMLKSLEATARTFRQWTESAKGRNEIAEYFRKIKVPLYEMGRLVRDVFDELVKMGTQSGLGELAHALRVEVLPVLVEVMNTTTASFGPHLIKALTAVIRLIGSLAGTSGALNAFVDILGHVADFLNSVATSNPLLHGLIYDLLTMAAIFKTFKFVGSITGISTLVGSFGKLTAAGEGSSSVLVAGQGEVAAAAARTNAVLGEQRALLIANSSGVVTGSVPVGAASSAEQVAAQESGWLGGSLSSRWGGIKGGAKGLIGRGVGALKGVGAPLAGAGLLIGGQLAGSAMGGRGGAVVSGMATGAGIGTMIAPGIGTGIGAAVGALGGALMSSAKGVGEEFGSKFVHAVAAKMPHIKELIDKKALGGLRTERGTIAREYKIAVATGASQEKLDAIHKALKGINEEIKHTQGVRDEFKSTLSQLVSGSITRMQDIHKVFQQNVTKINEGFTKGSKGWRNATANNMKAVVTAIGFGIDAGTIKAKTGMEQIKQLMNQIHLVQGDDPFKIAEAFTKSWSKSRKVTSTQITGLLGELSQMPPTAREYARKMVLEEAKELEKHGGAVKGTWSKLNSALETRFGTTKQAVGMAVVAMAKDLGIGVGSMNTATSAGMELLGKNVNNALRGLGVSKKVSFTLERGTQALVTGALGALGLGGGGGGKHEGKVNNATGGRVNRPSYVVGEEAPQHHEWVIATNPAYKRDNLHYWAQAGADLGVPGFAKGGSVKEPHLRGPGAFRDMGQGALHDVSQAANSLLWSHRPSSSSPSGPVPPGGPRRWLAEALKITGHLTKSNLAGLYLQMMSESSGNPHAINLTDQNALEGHPSKGLLQTIDSTFNAYKMKGHGDIWNPVDNAIAAIRYMFARYGHIVSTGHGYAKGGLVGGAARISRRAVEAVRNGFVGGFAKGGSPTAAWSGIGPSGLQSGIKNLAAYVMANYGGLSVTSTTGGTHAPGSLHYSGQAVDLASGDYGYMDKAAGWIKSSGLYRALAEGIHNPNLSVNEGAEVPSSFYSEVWADHRNHIHLGVTHPWSAPVAAGRAGTTGGGSGGAATKQPVPRFITGKYTKPAGSTSAGGGTSAEGETGHYKAQTEPINFPAIPTKLKDIVSELRMWQHRLPQYKAAYRKVKDSTVKAAIGANIKLIEARIKKLKDAAEKARHNERITRIIGSIAQQAEFLPWTQPGGLFAQAEDRYNRLQETAEQVLALEPEEPQTGVTGDWVKSTLEPYITGEGPHQEAGAFGAVLDAEAQWRNTVIGAEEAAGQSISSWREQISKITDRIKEIKSYKKDKPNAWKKYKGDIPDLERQRQQYREDIKNTQSQTLPEWAEMLASVQGPYATHQVLGSLPHEREVGGFGGLIWDTQGEISGLGLKIKNAQSNVGPSEKESALAELYKQQAEEANKRAVVSESLNPVFREFFSHVPRYGGKFHKGGVVPGTRDEERMVIAQGGEIFAQPGNLRDVNGTDENHLHHATIIEDGAIDTSKIRHVFGDEARKAVSTSRRRVVR